MERKSKEANEVFAGGGNLGEAGLCLADQDETGGAPAKSEILRGVRFGWFAYYCWAAGAIVLALALVLG